jgi:threonine dehydrogenase-like Zn-dependent dehydrogenase
MLGQGRISLKALATHSFPLDRIEEAFETFKQRIGGAIKVIVHPHREIDQ